MKTFKEFLQEKGISLEDFANKSASETAQLNTEYMNAVRKYMEDELGKVPTSKQLQDLEEKVKGFEKFDAEKAQNDLEEALDEIAQLKEKSNPGNTKKTLSEEIKENKEAIKNIARGQSGEVELKALTNRAAVSNSAAGYVLPEITQLGVKERSLYNVLPKVSVSDGNHAGVVRYRDWDEATTVRAAAMVAEGAAFPESTAKFAWYSKDLKKIGDTLPVTEEFMEDEQQFASELDMFLDVNVGLVVDTQLVSGDNTGQNLEGILTSAPAYTAANSGIAAANLKDLAIKVKNDITRTRGSKYRPDIIVVASSTMEDLVLAKDANNNYIFDENTGTIAGLNVVQDENMPDNQIVIGDRRFARIYEKGGTVISRGYVNGQFTEDEMTIKARQRMLLLIKNGDKTGFRKVTDVAAALTTLATAPV